MSLTPSHTSQAYVPGQLVRLLLTGTCGTHRPTALHCPCVALYVDLSGFTALTERLAEHGPKGAERLSEILNSCFGELVALVHHHGGEVQSFAGDAVLAVWWAEDEAQLGATCTRAARCGLVLRDALNGSRPLPDAELRLRVAVAVGEAVLFSVGGVEGRWEFFASGAPMRQLSQAIRAALPGEVQLSPEARKCLAEAACGVATADGGLKLLDCPAPAAMMPRPTPQIPERLQAGLRSYISHSVLTLVDAGQAEWMAEFRRVTVLFCALGHESFPGPEQLGVLQQAVTVVQASVYGQDGMVNQVMVDDKGTVVLAVWGVAMHSHEDDAVRALRAADAMVQGLRDTELSGSVGVASGVVFTGRRGSRSRCDYAVIGDRVNIAARLMQAAGEGILCDSATQALAANEIEFSPPEPLALRGRSDDFLTCRPLGPKAQRVTSTTPLVGRGRERADLREKLDALGAGARGLVVIEGEPGIGKSRLVADLLEQARGSGYRALVTGCDPIERSTPYHAWRGLLVDLLGLEAAPGQKGAEGRVQEALRSHPELAVNAPLLNTVLPVAFPVDDRIRRLTPRSRVELTHQLFLTLMRHCLQPEATVLVLEDVQWLDPSSWGLALELHTRTPALLLVLTTRPSEAPLAAEARELLSESAGMRLRLTPLTGDEAVRLVCGRLGVGVLPAELQAFVTTRAEGHPFFAEELAQALLESGRIEVAGGRCRFPHGAAALDGLGFPNSVEGLIVSRIDRLAPPQQLAVKVASVLGRSFTLAALRNTYPVPEDCNSLETHLAELERLQLTFRDTSTASPAFEFRHAITQEVAYNLLPYAQRRELHRRAATWYEHHSAAAPGYPLLAYHWERAGDLVQAIDCLEQAGHQAGESGAYHECSDFFRRAIHLREQDPAGLAQVADSIRVSAWRRQLSFARLGVGDLAGCREQLLAVLSNLGHRAPRSRADWAVTLLTGVAYVPLRRIMRGIVRGPQSRRAETLECALAAEQLMQPFYYSGQFLPFLGSGVLSLRLADQARTLAAVPKARMALALSLGTLRLHGLAERSFRRARDSARKAGRHYDVVASYYVKSVYLQGCGRWVEAEREARHALSEALDMGDPQAIEESQTVIGLVHVFSGRFTESAAVFGELLKSAGERANRHHEAWGLYGLARARLPLGRVAEAGKQIEQALALLDGLEDTLSETICHGLLCHVRVELAHYEGAREAANQVARRVRQSFMRSPVVLHGYTGACEAHLASWEAARAAGEAVSPELRANTSNACRELRTFARVFPMARPAAALYTARQHWLTGRRRLANRAWYRAIQSADLLGMPFEGALAYYDRGRLAGTQPADLEKAGRLFEAMGCRSYRDRVHALMAQAKAA